MAHFQTLVSKCVCRHPLQQPFVPKACCPCLAYYPPDPVIRYPPGCVVYDINPPPMWDFVDNDLERYEIAFTPTPIGIIQHVQIFPAIQRKPAREYVITKIDADAVSCSCYIPRMLDVSVTPCKGCPCMTKCPLKSGWTYPPGLVAFHDELANPASYRDMSAESYAVTFLPTRNGLIQHIQIKEPPLVGSPYPLYEPHYEPHTLPLYMKLTPFPSAELPADGNWVDNV